MCMTVIIIARERRDQNTKRKFKKLYKVIFRNFCKLNFTIFTHSFAVVATDMLVANNTLRKNPAIGGAQMTATSCLSRQSPADLVTKNKKVSPFSLLAASLLGDFRPLSGRS